MRIYLIYGEKGVQFILWIMDNREISLRFYKIGL